MTTPNTYRQGTDASTTVDGTRTSGSIILRSFELGEVEACLETVVVPGDLPSWVDALSQACEVEGVALRNEITTNHANHLVQLLAADMDQAQHAAQLQVEDAEILRLYDVFEGRVRRLGDRADLAGTREDKFNEGIRSIVDEGLGLVIRVRKQERALSTWLSEAFQRDTGVGD